ncbi:MAG TPA: ferredoxin reductase [Solirubrobacterales bacterium]|nr:ferredoxin reductase [Solirubrobacterales bacterium]
MPSTEIPDAPKAPDAHAAPVARARRTTKAAGRLLRSRLLEALTFPHGTERYVELVEPLAARDEVRAEVTEVRRQTPKSVTLTLAPNENWRGGRAGQFVGLTVEIDGRRETRPYSLAGSQHSPGGVLELTVSTHPEGLVSRWLRDHARPGLIVGLEPAAGEFTLPATRAERPESVLLISGGSGITPPMSILRTLLDEGFGGDIGFLNYARSPELALYGPELEALAAAHPNLRVARGYTEASDVDAPGAGSGISGRFRREHLAAVTPDHAAAATYVCGPPALIDAVRSSWAADRLPEPKVESFAPPQIDLDPAAAEGTVSFAASGTEAANSGLPILEQAEDAGLSPAHGCRMGICNTCSCRKASGTVRNVLSGETSSGEGEQIRICVSVPVGDVELEL